MSHEIDMSNDRANMAYVGQTPWHSLGNELTKDADIETWKTEAGFSHKIQRAVVRYAVAHGTSPDAFRSIDDKHVLLRSDTKAALGIVSAKYNIVQPGAVLEFFRDLVTDYGYTLNTAGMLFGGSRYWALADTSESADIGKGDTMRRYLLLSSSADGSMATEGKFTDIRVVCHNALTAARMGKPDVRVSHRQAFNANLAKRELGIGLHSDFENTISTFRRLADTRLLPADAALKAAQLFNPKASELAKDEMIKLMKSKPVTRVLELTLDGVAIGADFDGMKGTAWGFLNAVTEYVDHEARARSQDNRLNSAWFGKGDELKQRALELVSTDSELLPASGPDLLGQAMASWNR